MTKNVVDKVRLFALLEPLNIRISLCFPGDSLIADIHNFIDDVMRKYTIKYRVGRVEWNGAWILPQYKIQDFLEDKTEVTVYSIEYGLTLRTLSQERDRLHVNYSIFDQNSLNNKFIAKKTVRYDRKKKLSLTARTTELNGDEEEDEDVLPKMGIIQSEEHVENPKTTTTNKDKEVKESKEQKKEIHKPQQTQQTQQGQNSNNTSQNNLNKLVKKEDINSKQSQSNKNVQTQQTADKGKKIQLKQVKQVSSVDESDDDNHNKSNKKHKKAEDTDSNDEGEDIEDFPVQKTNQVIEKRSKK